MLGWLRRRAPATAGKKRPDAASTGAEAHRRSMGARPRQAPRVSAKERDGGGLMVTVLLARPRWQRALGGPAAAERTFALDAVGRQVYEWCDGKARVKDLVARFTREKKVHPAEAETAVAMFLRTLAGKGLIVMELDKPKGRK